MATKHRAHAPNRCRRGLRLGPRRGEGAPPGRVRPSSSWLPELLLPGRHKRRRSFLFRTFVEHPRAGTARSAGHAPYRTAGCLSSIEGKAAPAPPRSTMELATRIRDHLRPPVSGWKLGTEETGKQKPNKQREPLQKGPVQQIKIPVDNTDYTRRGL